MNRKLVSTVVALTTATALWAGCGSSSGNSGGSGGTMGTTSTSKTSTSTGLGGSFGGAGGGFGGSLPAISCNPVTNDGCDMGAACDYTQDPDTGAIDGFACYGAPNDALLCVSCDPTEANGPYCTGGTTCYPDNQAGTMGECARYCCTDADCGSGTCLSMLGGHDTFAVAPGLGICGSGSSSPDGGSGGAGSGGAGPDGGTDDGGGTGGGTADGGGTGGGAPDGGSDGGKHPFSCDAPATPPSMGSCVTVGM